MTRAWIATALLAGSWLIGLGYYGPANLFAWACTIVVAAVLLAGIPIRWPDRHVSIAAILLLLPTGWLMPLPHKAIPSLLACGLLLHVLPVPRCWPRLLGRGCVAASAILLVQALAMEGYASLTARCHELPWPLTHVIGLVPRMLGLDATVDGSWIVFRSVDQTRRIGATWDLLFDPASVCFLVGGLVLLGLAFRASCNRDGRWRAWFRSALCLFSIVLVWAPMRVGLLLGVVLHRSLRADTIAAPNVADILVNGWIHIILLAGAVLLAVRFVGLRTNEFAPEAGSDTEVTQGTFRSQRLGPLLVGLGTALLAFLFYWDPVGQPSSGRVMVVERHSTWEPTTEPYRTALYGEAGSYNYAAAYEYCGQYFDMSRLLETDSIDDRTLARCDVLVIKTPTARYSEDEVAAVGRFVDAGGALLMIGDHTNVFNMNTYLNDVSRQFGFTFRNDLLFRVGTPYVQKFRPPLVSHPIVQHVPAMKFAVSCSIDPGRSSGRAVVRNVGLWNLPPAYQEVNYHPQAEYRTDMQYGAWCQMWSTCHGKGRVVVFADSTLFSNFCVFQPGKVELFRGMLDWLNHRSAFDRAWAKTLVVLPLVALGMSLITGGLWRAGQRDDWWVPAAAAALTGWTIAVLVVIGINRAAMPVPPVQRTMEHVVIDRSVSDVPLFTGAFEDDKEGLGYGMLEQWIPRVGNHITRETGEGVFGGDAIVVICPTRSVDDVYRKRLVRFVNSGGHLLVFDSPDVEGSTANDVLWPFGLATSNAMAAGIAGDLVWIGADDVPQLELLACCSVTGGRPIARVGETPVAAQIRYGEGTVTAVGFGSLFNDATMGYHWLQEPSQETLEVYEVLYHLLRVALPAQPENAAIE